MDQCGAIVCHPFTGHPYICVEDRGHSSGHVLEPLAKGHIGPMRVLGIYATDTLTGQRSRLDYGRNDGTNLPR